MGSDNSARLRQAGKSLQREAARIQGNKRILIVAEGGKTEPNYFSEIRQTLRLPAASVVIYPSEDGTDPLNVVGYAERVFTAGLPHRKIEARVFDAVFSVFDRDAHDAANYAAALARCASLDGRLRNDAKQPIPFKAIVSVPCFELWLLLHYEDIQHPIDRFEALERLKGHITNYEKGSARNFEITRPDLPLAYVRARARALLHGPEKGVECFSGVPDLLDALRIPISAADGPVAPADYAAMKAASDRAKAQAAAELATRMAAEQSMAPESGEGAEPEKRA